MAHSSPRRRLQRALAVRRRIYVANVQAKRAPRPLGKAARLARRHVTAPWLWLALILGLIGLSILLVTTLLAQGGDHALTDSLTPIGAMLLATSSVPLVIGIMLSIGQPSQRVDHCGRCQFYRPTATSYQHGICGRDRARRPMLRLDGCEYFTYSERAMVRDRLSEASHVLNNTLSET
jgi:hypothetical protein